jgi:transposase
VTIERLECVAATWRLTAKKKGMNAYVGLDISLKRTSICVVDEDGGIRLEGTVASDPDAIANFVRARAPATRRVGMESGPTSVWLWRELTERGLPVICIDARHARAALSMQINKSDRNDAAGIARIMQTGWYREVQAKSPDSHATRALLNSRALLVRIQHDLENQVRGLLKISGLIVGRAKDGVFAQRTRRYWQATTPYWLRWRCLSWQHGRASISSS